MRCTKKIAAFLLAFAVILGIAGCAKTEVSKDSLVSALDSYGVEKTDDANVVLAALSRRGGEARNYYITQNSDEAGKLSNVVLNRFGNMPEPKAEGLVLAIVTEEGSDGKAYNSNLIYMTFADNKQAKETYNILVDGYGDPEEGKTGTRSNVTYYLESGKSAAGYNKIGTGIYLYENTVIFLRADSAIKDKFKFADTVCGKLGLPSLPKAS